MTHDTLAATAAAIATELLIYGTYTIVAILTIGSYR
jgi:hypothetical protein